MARATLAYRARAPLPALLVQLAAGDRSYVEVVDGDGAAAAPASGTYTLVDEAGQTVATGSTDLDDDATTARGPVVATTGVDVGDGYRERWTLTMSDGELVHVERDAFVCRYPLHCPISPADITRRSPQLDPTQASSISGSIDLDDFIDEAWLMIQARLIEAGRRPWLSTSASSLRDSVLELSHQLIYQRLATQHNAFLEHADRHRRAFDAAWGRVRLTYWTPEGDATAGRRSGRSGVLWLGSGR